MKRLEQLQTADGGKQPTRVKAEIRRELQRLELVLQVIKAVKKERNAMALSNAPSKYGNGQTNNSGEAALAVGRVLLRGTSMGNGHYGSAPASPSTARAQGALLRTSGVDRSARPSKGLSLPRMRGSALFRAPMRVRSALQGPHWTLGHGQKTLDSVSSYKPFWVSGRHTHKIVGTINICPLTK